MKEKHLTIYEALNFSEDATTERGEKVYTTLKVEFIPFGRPPVSRVIQCDKGVGFTEEWIEDTIAGCLEALQKDYPQDMFNVIRVKPNWVRFEHAGSKGVVN